jgi:hypothetical protein
MGIDSLVVSESNLLIFSSIVLIFFHNIVHWWGCMNDIVVSVHWTETSILPLKVDRMRHHLDFMKTILASATGPKCELVTQLNFPSTTILY